MTPGMFGVNNQPSRWDYLCPPVPNPEMNRRAIIMKNESLSLAKQLQNNKSEIVLPCLTYFIQGGSWISPIAILGGKTTTLFPACH